MQGDVERERSGRAEDGFSKTDQLYSDARAKTAATMAGESPAAGPDYLSILRDARPRLQQYYVEHLQANIDSANRAFRNKHFVGSKYLHAEYRNRSKLFRPKTRTAVRKAGAAAVTALFATSDAIKMTPGDASNPGQQANASLTQELFNYRTDRTSGRAAMPWFRICAGAHQDAMIASACISKQYWKQEVRKAGTQPHVDETTGEPILHEETGEQMMAEVYEPYIDRPDVMLFPLENIEIDPAANWLDPIQSASIFVAKMPMTIDEVMGMQEHPFNPWQEVSADSLRSMATTTDQAARAARQSREGGGDRMDSRYTGKGPFEIVWVFEVFMRLDGEDVCFWAAQDKAYLTDPKPVREVYPEQGGERPYTFGVINLESHRLFPMAPVESWQQLQIEANDWANLILDTAKLGVAPVTKVIRGKNVDLDALKRRGPNTQVLVTDKDDVTWEQQPQVGASVFQIVERLNVDFDDQAGQFNSGSVQTNRQLNETVGGMKLIAGAANAVGDFDQRVWIETWVNPTVAQVVKCIQYYEDDETILALCGKRGKLFEKFGVSEINDRLLQEQVTVKVNAGIGNADADQRLGKLNNAVTMSKLVMENNPDVVSGAVKPNLRNILDEVWGIAGYADGAERFFTFGQPQQNPNAGLEADKVKSEIDKNKKTGTAALITSLAAAAKVDLGDRELEASKIYDELDLHMRATESGHGHGLALRQHNEGRQDSRADAQHSQGMAQQQFEASREDAAAEQAAQPAGA